MISRVTAKGTGPQGRTERVRPRPKKFFEAEAKMYEAEAEAKMY